MDHQKPKVLIQLDPDAQASVFDSVVAVDSGIDHLLRHQAVDPSQVKDLVYGAIFTRGPQDLRNTAIFVGGSDVPAGEALLRQVTETFFGPMRVSVLMDSNGANTTAAAAVLAAETHIQLSRVNSLVLAGTGPVGMRVARLLARQQAVVRVGSRSQARAESVCAELNERIDGASVMPCVVGTNEEVRNALDGVELLVSAGTTGVELVNENAWQGATQLKVAIDLNAVPPLGIAGVEVADKSVERRGVHCYGAIGIGDKKMKIHKAAVRKLFEANDQVLDAEEIYALGREVG